MKIPLALVLALAVTLTAAAAAQDSGVPAQAGQDAGGYRGGHGQRGGRGGFGGMGMMGRGLMGTVTEAAADHYTIKTDRGDIYTVHYSANTRIFKMPAGMRGQGDADGGGLGAGRGMGRGGNPPEELKASDIKPGDVIEVRGETDVAAKSVGAVAVVQLDPERVAQIRAMEANFGKTWLMGRVTAIDGVKVTLTGAVDNAPHSFVADEDTTFRRRRDPITLADIQVGDTVRVDGAVKDGVFTAATVGVMGMTPGENPRPPRNDTDPSSPQ